MSGGCEGESIYEGYIPSRLGDEAKGDRQEARIMTNSQRVIVNTTAQYARTIINVCLSLYSTRLILSALGQSDYGIYSVVAGVIAMLSFVTNALVITTQRYLSISHGKKDAEAVHQVFGNSMLLHLLIGSTIAIILGLCGKWITHDLLNIEAGREVAAMWVYFAAVGMVLLSFITAPIRALFIARENIVYISIVDVIDGILKLLIAIGLSHINHDKLMSYAGLITGIHVLNLLLFSTYAAMKFEEFHIPRFCELNKRLMKELSSFAGWTTYSAGCIIMRNQGIAVVLNIFFGTIVNSAYGIAQQVLGAVQFLSTSILNAMNPQIMKAEGAGERQKMVRLCEYESKYAFLLLSLVAIPLIAEMNTLLQWWLGEVPQHAVMFCRFILVASLCDQISVGLTSANQAVGKIRVYTLVFYTFKLCVIILGWICLKQGLPIVSIMWCYVVIELMTSLMRLPLMKWIAGIAIIPFCKHVFGRIILPLAAMIAVCYIMTNYLQFGYRVLLTVGASVIVGIMMIWLTALDKKEKDLIKQSIKGIIRK